MAGQELSLGYEAPNKEFHTITEMVGGEYMLHECSCGSIVCCGSILHRARTNSLQLSDYYFLRVQCDPFVELSFNLK